MHVGITLINKFDIPFSLVNHMLAIVNYKTRKWGY